MIPYTLTGFYRLVKPGHYPWPCADEPNRTIELIDGDILTKDEDGSYRTHTGIMCFRIQLPDDAVVYDEGTCRLV